MKDVFVCIYWSEEFCCVCIYWRVKNSVVVFTSPRSSHKELSAIFTIQFSFFFAKTCTGKGCWQTKLSKYLVCFYSQYTLFHVFHRSRSFLLKNVNLTLWMILVVIRVCALSGNSLAFGVKRAISSLC